MLEVQAGIIAKLNAATEVTDIVSNRIYDQIPQHAVFPLIQVTQDLHQSYDASVLRGHEDIFRVDVISRKTGSVEALQIAEAVERALHNQPLTLSTLTFVNSRLINSQVRRDDDDVTVGVVQRYRIVTQEA